MVDSSNSIYGKIKHRFPCSPPTSQSNDANSNAELQDITKGMMSMRISPKPDNLFFGSQFSKERYLDTDTAPSTTSNGTALWPAKEKPMIVEESPAVCESLRWREMIPTDRCGDAEASTSDISTLRKAFYQGITVWDSMPEVPSRRIPLLCLPIFLIILPLLSSRKWTMMRPYPSSIAFVLFLRL